jgi:hypothetical protein
MMCPHLKRWKLLRIFIANGAKGVNGVGLEGYLKLWWAVSHRKEKSHIQTLQ